MDEIHPSKRRGYTVFLTGFSAAGKSTTAYALRDQLVQCDPRPVTVLDGDAVRKSVSSDLGFSREDRDANIRRIGLLAAEVTRNGGACICAAIAPYDTVRKEVRAMIEPHGGFFLVHVATPLAICESRDPKGLYARAHAGTLTQFTGITDPYEIPNDPEVTIDCSYTTSLNAAGMIVHYIRGRGYF